MQKAKRFLSSLKTFHLQLHFHYSRKDEKPEALFQLLLENQGLLDYVTHLTFSGNFDFHFHGDQVKFTLVSCPKLFGVSFPIKQRSSEEGGKWMLVKPENPSHPNIASFKTLSSIMVLKLKIDDFQSFTENFQFPPRLENLHLEFFWRDWDGNKDTVSFFAKFRQLTRLKSLSITIFQPINPNDIMLDFLVPLLRSCPKLETFECQFDSGSWSMSRSVFDLARFLDGIAHLQDLKSLKISSHSKGSTQDKEDFVVAFNPKESFVFPKLTLFHIDAWILNDFNFKSFLKSLPVSQTKKELNLSKINLHLISSFTKLLMEFNSTGNINSPRINLEILLHLDSIQDFKTFKKPIFLANNLRVHLKIYFPASEYRALLPTGVKRLQNIFQSFRFDIIMKLSTRSQSKRDKIEIRHIPLIINNFQQLIQDINQIKPLEIIYSAQKTRS